MSGFQVGRAKARAGDKDILGIKRGQEAYDACLLAPFVFRGNIFM